MGYPRWSTINLLLGLTVGLMCTFLALTFMSTGRGLLPGYRQRQVALRERGKLEMEQLGTHGPVENIDENLPQPMKPVSFLDQQNHKDDDSLAKKIYKEVRVLCWVMTSPQNLDFKAIHVKETWGKRCHKLIFISSVTNDSFPTVGLNVSEGREHLTAKTMLAFRYIFDHHMEDADWFMKADDDTYVILENLRYMLSDEDPNAPVYFGHHFKTIVKQGYLSGGAGYVLSKEAMRRFGQHGKNSSYCRQDGGAEDAEFGKCMEKLGVKVGNSTDSQGRSRFHCLELEAHILGVYPPWYYQYDANGGRKGAEYISDYAISFHYVLPQVMYELEFFLYHLRPYGIHTGEQDLNHRHSASTKLPHRLP